MRRMAPSQLLYRIRPRHPGLPSTAFRIRRLSSFAERKIATHSPTPSLVSSIPKGFLTSSSHSGIKKLPSLPDLAVVVSNRPASAAGVFTKNVFKAAPVQVCRETLRKRKGEGVRGVVVNSGCANAVTGQQGLRDARAIAAAVDACLAGQGSSSSSVDDGLATLPMSTGVIGQLLPSHLPSSIRPLFSSLGSSYSHWLATSKAFMTTDTFPKLRTTSFSLPSDPETTYSLLGIDKGAGMIHPDLAAPEALHGTLLALMLTDCAMAAPDLQRALSYATERSFNCITVDGDTSTNDSLILLANGASSPSAQKPITEASNPKAFQAFTDTLASFAASLAQLIVRDGEGATKLVRVRVCESPTYAHAKWVASSVATSSLFKCALHGADANWGRVLCAVGYAHPDPPVEPGNVSVSFVDKERGDELRLLKSGEPEVVDEERARRLLEREEVEVVVRLGMGREEASYWSCDFSREYIDINGDYRS